MIKFEMFQNKLNLDSQSVSKTVIDRVLLDQQNQDLSSFDVDELQPNLKEQINLLDPRLVERIKELSWEELEIEEPSLS